MLSDRCLSCPVCPVWLSVLSVMLVYCGQTVGWIKMKLGVQVGLGPGHIVLDGDPTPPLPQGQSPRFSAHYCCGQMAGWINMPLGMEVGLGPGDFVLDGPPFPSNRHHQSNGDCLEGKREKYQVCSAQYCVQQLYTVNCTHIWTDLTVLWIGFCLTSPISLCLDSFLCMYYFVPTVYCMHV